MSDPDQADIEAAELIPSKHSRLTTECTDIDHLNCPGILQTKPNAYWLVCACRCHVRPAVAARLRARDATIADLRAGYNEPEVSSKPCPGCKYVDGKFIELCGLHRTIDELRAELAALKGD